MARVVLETEKLTRRFGSLVAVDGLSLAVEEGEVFGFLGPNGAGKTTAISMMCGLLRADAGRVRIQGRDLDEKNRGGLGVCPQSLVIWPKLSCLEQLVFVGELYGLAGSVARARSMELLNAMGLEEKADRLAHTLSGGMQRRLNLILALIHDPAIVFLDEPEAGLDPQSRVLVRDYVKGLARRRTVILTTHNMDEAERLADRVAIMDHGKLLALDRLDGIKALGGKGDLLEITVADVQRAQDAFQLVKAREPAVTLQDRTLSIMKGDALSGIADIAALVTSAGIALDGVRVRRVTLEDAFLAMTGRALRE